MPLVDVSYRVGVPDEQLRRMASVLPHVVSVAVECPEEPYDGELRPGDVEVRFRERSELDVGELDVVIEVRSTWLESRAANRQQRCAHILEQVRQASGLDAIGAYLMLPVAAWSQ